MPVIHLAVSGEIINNCLSVVGLPPTGPRVAPNYTISFPECVANEANTVYVTGLFGEWLDDRLDRNYFCCNPIDGGSA